MRSNKSHKIYFNNHRRLHQYKDHSEGKYITDIYTSSNVFYTNSNNGVKFSHKVCDVWEEFLKDS